MPTEPCILFTAFEPSGDEHAAVVIAELRRLRREVPIMALGGPAMRDAGATLIEQTTDRSAMLTGSIGKAREQIALRRRFRVWLDTNPVAVHVPTDSPAANWWFCKTVKRQESWGQEPGPRVIHLVAPQVWAWAPWRVKRLKRWSDLVLCILPFEPAWFAQRGVEARFVGHPLFDHDLEDESLHWESVSYPNGSPKLALLPGSRPGEIAANWPLMLEVFRRLRTRYPRLEAIIAAANEPAAAQLRRLTPAAPQHLRTITSRADAVLHWADLVLTVSGTATLHIARHRKPMAVLYRVSPVQWHAFRWLMTTGTFTLPNLIATGGPCASSDGHIVREFVPFTGDAADVQPIVDELASLIDNPEKRAEQAQALGKVVEQFRGHRAGPEAAQAIAHIYGR